MKREWTKHKTRMQWEHRSGLLVTCVNSKSRRYRVQWLVQRQPVQLDWYRSELFTATTPREAKIMAKALSALESK